MQLTENEACCSHPIILFSDVPPRSSGPIWSRRVLSLALRHFDLLSRRSELNLVEHTRKTCDLWDVTGFLCTLLTSVSSSSSSRWFPAQERNPRVIHITPCDCFVANTEKGPLTPSTIMEIRRRKSSRHQAMATFRTMFIPMQSSGHRSEDIWLDYCTCWYSLGIDTLTWQAPQSTISGDLWGWRQAILGDEPGKICAKKR